MLIIEVTLAVMLAMGTNTMAVKDCFLGRGRGVFTLDWLLKYTAYTENSFASESQWAG
jgi:hypothetical protein